MDSQKEYLIEPVDRTGLDKTLINSAVGNKIDDKLLSRSFAYTIFKKGHRKGFLAFDETFLSTVQANP